MKKTIQFPPKLLRPKPIIIDDRTISIIREGVREMVGLREIHRRLCDANRPLKIMTLVYEVRRVAKDEASRGDKADTEALQSPSSVCA